MLAGAGAAFVENWRILKTGIYHIKAMCDGCVTAVSNRVEVIGGEPFFLRLLQQPSESSSGAVLSVVPLVEATDFFGNRITDLDGEVYVRLIEGAVQGSAQRE